jgi:two-component system, NtrC family, sensor kinase
MSTPANAGLTEGQYRAMPSHRRHRVLIVDDDAQVLQTLREILVRADFEVLTAQNAEKALATLEHSLPCLVLTDVDMPGMNGLELCRRIKDNPRTAHLPVALVTALVQDAEVKEGIVAGATDYIKKPFDNDEVLLRVRMQLRLHDAWLEQRRLHKHLTVINAAARDGIIMLDGDGTILHWNEAAERIFGYASEEVLGQNLHSMLAPNQLDPEQGGGFERFVVTGGGAAVEKALEVTATRKSGLEFPAELSLASASIDDKWCAVGIVRDITARKRLEYELKESEERFRSLFEASCDALMTLEPPSWKFTSANPATLAMFRAESMATFLRHEPTELSPEKQWDGRLSSDAAKERIDAAMREGSASFEWTHKRIDGEEFPATVSLSRVGQGQKRYLQATVRDISEQKWLEAELGHARKLEAVGQLAAGIAHEINTPIQYVGDSVQFLKEAFAGYQRLGHQYQLVASALETAGGYSALAKAMHETEEAVDLGYLDANVLATIERSVEGISRITTIVRAMKEFAHPDQREKAPADLNLALRNTLVIAQNEYKYVAEVDTELGELPPVFCHVGDLNQVFLNLIVNAAHAIGDVVGKTGTMGKICVKTWRDGDWIQIEFADTGAGIPEPIRHRIFEPFFTTKPVGKGSGQGLAIAHCIIVGRHHGTLTYESEGGKGTTFVIRLPMDGKPEF